MVYALVYYSCQFFESKNFNQDIVYIIIQAGTVAMKLNFIVYQNNDGLKQETRMNGLARSSKSIHVKHEQCTESTL